MSPGSPSDAAFVWCLAVDTDWRQMFLTSLELLVPVALLCSLFCARLGVERGQALAGGTLPGWLFFGALLFAVEESGSLARQMAAAAPSLGLMLLATFAAIRADPPAPSRVAWGWTLAAGVLGALSVCVEPDTLGCAGGLPLYVWWSAGWRRALGFALVEAVVVGATLVRAVHRHEPSGRGAFNTGVMLLTAALIAYGMRRWRPPDAPPAVETGTPGALPMGSAHRMIGVLLFLALMALVAGAAGEMPVACPWEFIACPLGVAASLGLTSLLARAILPRRREG